LGGSIKEQPDVEIDSKFWHFFCNW